MSHTVKSISTLVSACLVHTTFGAIYTLGTITPYVASYLKYNGNPDIRVVDISINYPAMMVTETIMLIVSMLILQKYLALKLLCAIGVYGFALSVLISSYMNTLASFTIFYGGFYGGFLGVAYMAPIKNAYAYYPNKKGMCAGISMMGYGIGSFLYNQIFLHLINPNNLPADEDHFFPPEVANNFPFALRIMAAVYFTIGTLACLFFFENQIFLKKKPLLQQTSLISETQQIENISNNNQKSEFGKLIRYFKQNKDKKKQFLQLSFIIFSSSIFGVFFAYNYKQYGQTITDSDHLITLVGSIGAILSSIGRVSWCYLFDYLSFRTILSILNTGLLTICILCIFIQNQVVYFSAVLGAYFFHGAFYGLMPTQAFRVFGDQYGSYIYPFLFFAFTCSSIIQFVFHEIVIRNWGNGGFKIAFIVFGIFQLLGLILVQKFKFVYQENQINKAITTTTNIQNSDEFE